VRSCRGTVVGWCLRVCSRWLWIVSAGRETGLRLVVLGRILKRIKDPVATSCRDNGWVGYEVAALSEEEKGPEVMSDELAHPGPDRCQLSWRSHRWRDGWGIAAGESGSAGVGGRIRWKGMADGRHAVGSERSTVEAGDRSAVAARVGAGHLVLVDGKRRCRRHCRRLVQSAGGLVEYAAQPVAGRSDNVGCAV